MAGSLWLVGIERLLGRQAAVFPVAPRLESYARLRKFLNKTAL
jgi:hypothetical protein